MKKLLILVGFILMHTLLNAQSRWEDHFNYALVQEIHQIGNKLYCVSSNALFTYHLDSKEIEKISKVNLLNGVKPTSAAYNSTLDNLLIGYENGALDILGEESENFIEIPLDDYTGSKRINHIATHDNLMLISAAYGVSIFDLDRREFAETAFFRMNGEYIKVNESDVLDGYLYAASEQGVFSHPINELIPNFNNWTLANGLPVQNFQHLQKFGDKLLASSSGNLYALIGGNWSLVGNYGDIKDLNVNDNHLIVSTPNQIIVLNESLQTTAQETFGAVVESGIFAQGQVYAGTLQQGLINASFKEEEIYPDGPYSNHSYHVAAQENQIWVAPGGQLNYNVPSNNQEGYFHFNGVEWIHHNSQALNNAQDIIHISYNPQNLNEVFAATWGNNHGLLAILDDRFKNEYLDIFQNINENGQGVVRLGGSAIDREGNLYVTQSFIAPTAEGHSAIWKKSPTGQWTSFKLNPPYSGGAGIKEPVIDRSGYVWAAQTRGDGVVVTNMNNLYRITAGEGTGNLPSNNVYAIALDDYGTAWIGTSQGLRIKRNPIVALEGGDMDTEPVVIVQNGVPEALLTDTAIKDITVDSSNRKWIATQGAGVFYIAESGREIIYHFTEDLSPLPSNSVNAIAVDTQTGKVFFATENGLVSYQGDAVDTGDSFGEIIAYPNPVRPAYEGPITIKGLARNSVVTITDVVGNLVYRGKEAGGIVQWDQTNLKGKKVASGIYIVMLISGDGLERETTKIAIIR